jgi:hypothetical protein
MTEMSSWYWGVLSLFSEWNALPPMDFFLW